MAVSFDLGNGTICTVQDNAQTVFTQRGPMRADQVVQGDHICYLNGESYVEVIAPPVVS